MLKFWVAGARLSLFVLAACGEAQISRSGFVEKPAEQVTQTALIVEIDSQSLSWFEASRMSDVVLDYMLNNQRVIERDWGGVYFRPIDHGGWRFLALNQCEEAKSKLSALFESSLSARDFENLQSAMVVQCFDASEYFEFGVIELNAN